MKYRFIHYNENDKLNGIFVYLNEYYPKLFEFQTSKQITDNGALVLTKRDPNKPTYWATANNDPEMIISFTHPILLTSYTFENAGSGYSWMMNWTIFGSNDKRNWKLIDQRKGEIFCDSPYSNTLGLHCFDTKTISYFVDNPKFYSQFKIRNDLNSCDEKYIIMHSLEFHGLTTFQTLKL